MALNFVMCEQGFTKIKRENFFRQNNEIVLRFYVIHSSIFYSPLLFFEVCRSLREHSHISKFSPIFYFKILAHYLASYCLSLPAATKLGQGNIFTSVCQEFCPQGGVLSPGGVWSQRGSGLGGSLIFWGVSNFLGGSPFLGGPPNFLGGSNFGGLIQIFFIQIFLIQIFLIQFFF